MSSRSSNKKTGRQKLHLILTIALIAAIWIVSDVGFYVLLPVLGLPASYNASPVATTLYYIFWVGVAVITFWPQYATWPRYARWTTFEHRLTSFVVWSLAFAGAVLFAAYVLPALPPFHPREVLEPPEVAIATPWYFLPKSVEILLQQLLIVALVLSLSAERYGLRKISISCAVLFGGTHILLAFGGVPWGYVIRFAALATVFGFVFPYLILRVPKGFAYSYIAHWGYYALTVLQARTVGAGVVDDFLKQLLGGS